MAASQWTRKMTCSHINFSATLKVHRVVTQEPAEGQEPDIAAYMAEIRVQCADCGNPFEWVGFPMGIHSDQARVDISGQQLNAPLKPQGVEKMKGFGGFDVKVYEPDRVRDMVRQHYRNADAVHLGSKWKILDNPPKHRNVIGEGSSNESAWADAFRRLTN